jgi:hypothetical protein
MTIDLLKENGRTKRPIKLLLQDNHDLVQQAHDLMSENII